MFLSLAAYFLFHTDVKDLSYLDQPATVTLHAISYAQSSEEVERDDSPETLTHYQLTGTDGSSKKYTFQIDKTTYEDGLSLCISHKLQDTFSICVSYLPNTRIVLRTEVKETGPLH